MDEFYNLIPLIKLYIFVNLFLVIITFILILWYVIKKGMLKFAFRKNNLWNLQEKHQRLEQEISFLKDDILIKFTNYTNKHNNGKKTKN